VLLLLEVLGAADDGAVGRDLPDGLSVQLPQSHNEPPLLPLSPFSLLLRKKGNVELCQATDRGPDVRKGVYWFKENVRGG
jgi:hypothetical protein